MCPSPAVRPRELGRQGYKKLEVAVRESKAGQSVVKINLPSCFCKKHLSIEKIFGGLSNVYFENQAW